MRKLLNTLFVTTQGVYISKKGETLQVKKDGKVLLQLPLIALESVVCFGRIGCSPYLMGALADSGIALTFLTESGRLLAVVRGFTNGNVLLRRQQYRIADDHSISLEISKNIVLAKISNARSVLLRAARDTPVTESERAEFLRSRANRLLSTFTDIRNCPDINTLRGYEGEAATHYFSCLNSLQTKPPKPEDFQFNGRSRRPPLDRINALISFVYTLLMADCRAACEAVGLDSCVGFLHDDRPGKPSLALDLMEELRAPIADRLVLSLINRKQVLPSGFEIQQNGAVLMDIPTRKAVLVAWQNRKREEIQHPFTLETMPIGLIPHIQAMLLSRYIRGDLDAYPPFLAKS